MGGLAASPAHRVTAQSGPVGAFGDNASDGWSNVKAAGRSDLQVEAGGLGGGAAPAWGARPAAGSSPGGRSGTAPMTVAGRAERQLRPRGSEHTGICYR